MSSTLWVPFSGDGAGTGELTWGQRDIWQMMEMSGTTRMVGGTTPLATGTTVTHIAHLLSFIVSRHQSLRTRISLTPGGTPTQVLASTGEVALEIVDATDDADPASVAATVRSRYGSAPIDLATEWPVRMAVIQQGGKPVYFAVMYPHVVIDGYGVDGVTRRLIRVQVSNRFRPGFAHSVSTLVQPGLCVIDVAPLAGPARTLAEAAQQAWRSELAAGKHGYYDPRDLPALTPMHCPLWTRSPSCAPSRRPSSPLHSPVNCVARPGTAALLFLPFPLWPKGVRAPF